MVSSSSYIGRYSWEVPRKPTTGATHLGRTSNPFAFTDSSKRNAHSQVKEISLLLRVLYTLTIHLCICVYIYSDTSIGMCLYPTVWKTFREAHSRSIHSARENSRVLSKLRENGVICNIFVGACFFHIYVGVAAQRIRYEVLALWWSSVWWRTKIWRVSRYA